MKIANILGAITAIALISGAACSRQSDTSSGAANDQTGVSAGQGAQTPPVTAHEADNTGRNVRDRADEALTPGDQGSTDADRETTRKIRRAITSNDQLSSAAKNIKIITIDGKVTLRGPVQTDQEKEAIARIAKEAGVQSLDNQLELKAQNINQ